MFFAVQLRIASHVVRLLLVGGNCIRRALLILLAFPPIARKTPDETTEIEALLAASSGKSAWVRSARRPHLAGGTRGAAQLFP
jgi:hypothetical protein